MGASKALLALPLLSISALIQGEAAASEQSTHQAYTDARNSFFGNEIGFSCSGFDFKYANSLIGGESLFIRRGLDWAPIDDFESKDNGLTFTMGAEVPINELSAFTELPEIRDIQGNVIQSEVARFLSPSGHLISDFNVEVDLYAMEMRMENLDYSSIPVNVNERRYISSQLLIEVPDYETDFSAFSRMGEAIRELSALEVKEEYSTEGISPQERQRKKQLEASIQEMKISLEGMDETSALIERKTEENTEAAKEALEDLEESTLYATAHPRDVSKRYWCR